MLSSISQKNIEPPKSDEYKENYREIMGGFKDSHYN